MLVMQTLTVALPSTHSLFFAVFTGLVVFFFGLIVLMGLAGLLKKDANSKVAIPATLLIATVLAVLAGVVYYQGVDTSLHNCEERGLSLTDVLHNDYQDIPPITPDNLIEQGDILRGSAEPRPSDIWAIREERDGETEVQQYIVRSDNYARLSGNKCVIDVDVEPYTP